MFPKLQISMKGHFLYITQRRSEQYDDGAVQTSLQLFPALFPDITHLFKCGYEVSQMLYITEFPDEQSSLGWHNTINKTLFCVMCYSGTPTPGSSNTVTQGLDCESGVLHGRKDGAVRKNGWGFWSGHIPWQVSQQQFASPQTYYLYC